MNVRFFNETREGHGVVAVAVSYFGLDRKFTISIAEARGYLASLNNAILAAESTERSLNPVQRKSAGKCVYCMTEGLPCPHEWDARQR